MAKAQRADDKRRRGAGNRISRKTEAADGNGAASSLGIFNDRRRANGKAKRAG